MQQTVLITGATGGIGRAAAIRFAKAGYFVFCHGRNGSSDFSVTEAIRHIGGECTIITADMANETEVEKMFSEIRRCDVLINNAGTVSRKKPITAADFRRTLEINVVAPYLCSILAKAKGVHSIVNVGSMRGLPQSATTPDYSASKAALHNLTSSLARQFAPECRVNAVAPGFTRTAMHQGNAERLRIEADKTPLKRIAEPEEVAEAIFFLATEASSFVTGHVLPVDGGRSFSEG